MLVGMGLQGGFLKNKKSTNIFFIGKMNPLSLESMHSLDPQAMKLYEKYKALKMNSDSTQISSEYSRADSRSTDIQSITRLDSMMICSHCQGLGICQEIYNHQSRSVNCPQCDSEGIIWKGSNGERMKPLVSTDKC